MSVHFHDLQPELDDLQTSVVQGLQQSPKQIHPKFFYDETGSGIFEQICEQPEYYLPDIERSICEDHALEIIASLGEGCHLIEPGAGSSHKVRFLLNRVRPAMYVPMDISAEHLKISAARLAEDYPLLPIHAVCVDHTKSYQLPDAIPGHKRVFFYPGSSLGNFDPEGAIAFLQDLHHKAGQDGGLLIGIDNKKATSVLNRAYNDANGVTAAFNRNLLQRIQNELDCDLDSDSFAHHAFYNEQYGRIEMHLRSDMQQQVRINGDTFHFQAGETIHTESSYKYTPAEFSQLARQAGWEPVKVWQDENEYFSLHFLRG